MISNLPINRVSSAPRTAGNAASPLGATAEDGGQEKGLTRLDRDLGGIALKVERHGRWALMSRAQSQLSRIQASEQAIINSYRQLLSLARQLEAAGSKTDALASKVAELRQQIEQGKMLDNNLKRKESAARASYLLERVDLLSPRNQSEQLGLQLPSGATVNLKLEANASREQNLQQLKGALEKHGLSPNLTTQGQLRIQGNESQLSSPWVFHGQGVRVPAGNPVPIQLNKETDELTRLETGLVNGEHKEQKQRVRQLLQTLEQERRALENQRQQLLREIAQLNMRSSQTAPSDDSGEMLRDTLRNGDFSLQLSTLLAQANVSRFAVVAILAR
jgi:hypothetical protein